MNRLAVILVALVAAAPGATAIIDQLVATQPFVAPYHVRTSREIEEPSANDLAALGQGNCVVAATNGNPEARCPLVATSRAFPPVGIRILDAAYHGEGPSDPQGDVEGVMRDPHNGTDLLVADVFRGSNAHRGTGGAAPEVILPGRAQFRAWHGYWSDENPDGDVFIDWSGGKPRLGNEFVGVWGEVASYIEPGSRPTVTSTWRPSADSPDVFYAFDIHSQSYQTVGERVENAYLAPIVFVDGSLLQTFTVWTVSDPVFAPDGHGRPYTAGATSLVDVDRYPAQAPAALVGIYGQALAPTLNTLGSPSLGLCPGGCVLGPLSAPGPLEEASGAVWSLHYAVSKPEWEATSGSSAAGRRADFEESLSAWADLRLLTTPGPSSLGLVAGPVAGRASDGTPTPAPGFVTFDIWYGLWHDRNRDGYVGEAGENADRGGARPNPDDYAQTAGEFVGRAPTASPTTTASAYKVTVTARPFSDWGPGVAMFDHWGFPVCPGSSTSTYVPDCRQNGLLFTGDRLLSLSASESRTDRGRYLGKQTLFFPAGSPGFELCVETTYIRHGPVGLQSADAVFDCDTFAPWGEVA